MSQILSDSSLSTSEETTAALDKLRAVRRFNKFKLFNNTTIWTVKLCLFEGHDEVGPILSGYQKSTGVTVGGVDVLPESDQTTELQPQVKVQATRVESVLGDLVSKDGDLIKEFKLKDKFAPEGKFFNIAVFSIRDKLFEDGTRALEVESTFHFDDGSEQIEIDLLRLK